MGSSSRQSLSGDTLGEESLCSYDGVIFFSMRGLHLWRAEPYIVILFTCILVTVMNYLYFRLSLTRLRW